MVLKELKKNIRKKKFIGEMMMMVFHMINTGLIQPDLIKMVMIYMDLIKME